MTMEFDLHGRHIIESLNPQKITFQQFEALVERQEVHGTYEMMFLSDGEADGEFTKEVEFPTNDAESQAIQKPIGFPRLIFGFRGPLGCYNIQTQECSLSCQ